MSERPFDERGRITATPGVQGGRPCLMGTRFPTRSVWTWWKQGFNVSQILAEYPHLTREDVLAAVAFEQGRRWKRDTVMP